MSTVRNISRSLRAGAAIFAVLTAFAMVPHARAGEPSAIGPYDINVSHGLTFTDDPDIAPAPLALRGYDPVSYFSNGSPQLGSSEHAVAHLGAIYWFTSDEHRDAFVAAPDDFLAQYGGFCAFGVTQETKFDGDPLLWNIDDGKLYLNVTPQLQAMWLDDLDDNVEAADAIWPQIRADNPQGLFEAWAARQ